jgi:teichuronic acid biosynthesis glycosyltransferase TuaC
MATPAPALHRDPIRVLTLTPFYPHAGDSAAGCFVAEPLSRLQDSVVTSDIIAVQPLYRGLARACPSAPAATWVHFPSLPGSLGLPSAGEFLSARLISKLRKLSKAQSVDLVHAHAALPCGHAAMLLRRKFGIPFVITVHGLDVFYTNQVERHARNACEQIVRQVYGLARQVICISKKVASEIAKGGCGTRLALIYNAVDSEMFRPPQVVADSKTILSVGNLIPIKGHELLLRAFAVLERRFPQLRCNIIGDGPERSRLVKLARDLTIAGKVRFLGRQNRKQIAEAMQHCTLFVLPSRYEGLGCVYLEAMSTGKPVIACHGQGIAEIIEHGRSGWLIAPNNVSELVSACSTLLEDELLRRQIGQAARTTILQNFTLDHQAARLADLYRECLR